MNGKIPDYVSNGQSYTSGCRIVVRLSQQNWAEKINTTELAYFMSQNVYGHAVPQLVEALRYKPGDRGFDSRRCHWSFSLT